MTDHRKEPDELDAFFAAARRDTPALSQAALDRMTAQALEVQAGFATAQETTAARSARSGRPGRIAQMLAAVGGWPGMAGLATAGVAGFWIGAVPPAGLVNLAVDLGAVSSSAEDDLYLVDPLPGYTLSLDTSEAQ